MTPNQLKCAAPHTPEPKYDHRNKHQQHISAALITRIRFGRPDASLCANGWFGGLVAGSASCALLPPVAAALIGAVAGALGVYSVEWLDVKLAVDDPGGAVSVHGVAGIWGLLALGIFGVKDQWIAQVVGVATLIGSSSGGGAARFGSLPNVRGRLPRIRHSSR